MIVNAAGPFVDELNTAVGARDRAPDRLLEGHPPRRPAAHDHPPRPGARLLRRHAAAVLRHPDGAPLGDRHHRHPLDTPFTSVDDDDRQFLLEQINARLDLPDRSPSTTSSPSGPACGRSSSAATPAATTTTTDWTSLSRKHEIERDDDRTVVTVFGGKLTDCLNVGEEVAHEVEQLGVPLEHDLHNWYGEPAKATRTEFYRQAKLMKLDRLRPKPDTEPLTDRLWRRYGRRAFDLLEAIRADPTMGEDVMDSADYLRAELYTAAQHEMIVKLDDFMRRRRRSISSCTTTTSASSPGLREVAEILFGADAERAPRGVRRVQGPHPGRQPLTARAA